MASGELAGKAQTVLGPVDPKELGITLTHEHFLEDDGSIFVEPGDPVERQFAYEPVSLGNLDRIFHAPASNLDNLVTLDVENMIKEAREYKAFGGNTVVDVTPVNLGRDADGLVRISQASGIHIIMGCGYYREMTLHPKMIEMSEDEITEEVIQDVTVGVGPNQVRSGIIGEIGCSYPLTDHEKKNLRAGARAQAYTGAPLSIHPGYGEPSAPEIIDVLTDAGADLNRTIMCHIDISVRQEDTRRQVAESGCYLSYDHIGRNSEYYYPNVWTINLPDDLRRVHEIIQLIDWGYLEQILISTDASAKCCRPTFGGWGYVHILKRFVPLMKRSEVSDDAIHTILVENPKSLMTFV